MDLTPHPPRAKYVFVAQNLPYTLMWTRDAVKFMGTGFFITGIRLNCRYKVPFTAEGSSRRKVAIIVTHC